VNVLAIDQGTSSTKALLVADGGVVLAEAEVAVRRSASVLWSRRARLVPARPFSMSDEWLERVDPAGGPVTIALSP
jgi:glycerol kinase